MPINVQVVWENSCRYWDVEPRYAPIEERRLQLNAEEASRRRRPWRPGERDWHITALNLWGSVFCVSAVGAYVQHSGELTNATWSNGGTLLGAACFLIASVLMMGEGRRT